MCGSKTVPVTAGEFMTVAIASLPLLRFWAEAYWI